MIGLRKTDGRGIDTLEEHVRQSIGDILTTPVGSRIMRRDYGSALPELIDQPLNQKTLLRLYAATAAAVMRWEPRFLISGISLAFEAPAGARVEISGSLNNQAFSTRINLDGAL